MTAQQERLRLVAVSIRTKPTPLSDFIPLLNQTAVHIDALTAENERLKALADSEGTRAVEYLRRARDAEDENERLRKDAERLDYIEESGNFGVTRYRSGPSGPVLIEAEDGKKDISKSASSLRDAIDSVIKEAKGTP